MIAPPNESSPAQRDVDIHIADLKQAAPLNVRDYGPTVPDSTHDFFEPLFVDGSGQFSTGRGGMSHAIVNACRCEPHGIDMSAGV
jgi:hypothetical protein